MKAISIRAPWWWYILHAGKDIENRDWPTHMRGRVYLHAGKTMPVGEVHDDMVTAAKIAGLDAAARPGWDELHRSRGCLVGSVEVVDCVRRSASPWFFGAFGFVLRNPVVFAEPVPCKGSLGWFDVKPEIGVADRAWAAGNLFGEVL